MSKVHDNEILSYEVDLQNDQIKLHTKYDDNRIIEETDIVFTEVFNHFFEHQLKSSIILDIYESDILKFIKGNSELLRKQKSYGWPVMYDSINEMEQILIEGGYKYIILMSSYGMNGWVLAKNFEIITRKIK
ncbi:hypothetical protein GC102_31375 [Paenibacillus sp. LMG 31460]|uniref:Uncharacterized protein n=1 Tax=Paenibacillus germinis TaxID=2654979 RepID=A0ABX1ZA81_9BACL|nr:hypothetical protein [Paenibacillus germinis]NOU90213.1 hypothetical protein [Paenibacillus germinis]